ncbi:hypothetical protein OAS39_00775 [Pirellulales bacterium]|nr:hypothetical protein [Pirellulales bacterium]
MKHHASGVKRESKLVNASGKFVRTAGLLGALSLPALVSCGPQAYVPTGQEAEQIRQLAVAYMQYLGSHNGRSPKSEMKFREYLELALEYDHAEIDAMLISPRDGEPYHVVYNVRITGSKPVVVAHEQSGLDGTRYIAFDFGGVEMADEQRFAKLVGKPETP